MNKPSVGKIVHFVLPEKVPGETEGSYAVVPGEVRAAMIVRVWADTCVNLHVFADGANDHETILKDGGWVTSVMFDAEAGPRTWHWPERIIEVDGKVIGPVEAGAMAPAEAESKESFEASEALNTARAADPPVAYPLVPVPVPNPTDN